MDRNISEKTFSVVFKRNTPMSDEENMPEDSILQIQHRKITRNIPKAVDVTKVDQTSIEKMLAEPKEDNESHIDEAKFKKLLHAVMDSTVKETRATDKFVNDIESLMNSINNNLGKLQLKYESILKKLPKIEHNK